MNIRHSLALLTTLVLAATSVLGQYPITVQPQNLFPIPTTYADLPDDLANLTLLVTNTASTATQVRVSAQLTCTDCEEPVSIRTIDDAVDVACSTIDPGVHSYSLSEFASQFSSNGSFNTAHFEIIGGNASFNTIQSAGMLPGGTWLFCVQVISCDGGTPLSEPIPNTNGSCISFTTPEAQPPVISETFCGSTFTQPNGQIFISWTFAPVLGFTGSIEYEVDIVQYDSLMTNANEAILDNAGPWLYTQTTAEPFLTLQAEELVQNNATAAGSYAVRVQARSADPNDPIPVDNDGFSVVCEFAYLPNGSEGSGALRPIYPHNGDWIPFNFIPIIAKFEPEGTPYTRFDFHTWMEGASGTPSLPEREDHDSWPNGPVIDQGLSGQGSAEYRASLLPIYYAKTNMPGGANFQRGGSYIWRTAGDLTRSTSATVHGDTGEEPFHIGMGPSVPSEPSNGATVPRGAVALKWWTAEIPDRLTPPGDIVQLDGIHGSTQLNAFDGHVDEHWKLEVSRSSGFETLFAEHDGAHGGIDYDIVNLIQDPSMVEVLYGQLTHTVNVTEDGTYYWRLKWYKDPANESAGYYNTSPVFSFVVGSGTPTTPPVTPDTPPTDEEACVAICAAEQPTNTSLVETLTAGAKVQIGQFQMTVEEAVDNGASFTGRGTIVIPFLNNVPVKVAFTDLKLNTANQAFGACTVRAVKDYNDVVVSMVTTGVADIPSLSQADRDMLTGMLEYDGRLISVMTGSVPIGMPLGIDKDIDGRRVTIGLINMEFTPARAHMDIIAGVEITEWNTTLAFGLGDICIGPTGFAGEQRAYLAENFEIHDGGMTYRLNGGASTDLANLTYMDWDCHGFKCLQLGGGIGFPRESIIPSPDVPGQQVFARFTTKMCRHWDFMAKVSMDPFEPAGAPEWVLTVDSMWWDMSHAENPSTLTFPEGYEHAALAPDAPGGRNMWRGFYAPTLNLRAPLPVSGGGPPQWSVNDVIIDATGLTLNTSIEHLIRIEDQRHVEGWAFSLDSIWLDVLQNRFRTSGLKGKVGVPYFGPGDELSYSAIVGYIPEEGPPPTDQPVDHTGQVAQTGLTYTMNVTVDHDLNVPMWVAKAHLEENSRIDFVVGHDTYLRADLSGALSIDTYNMTSPLPSAVPNMSFDVMRFEHLVLDTDDNMTSCQRCTVFGLASPQHTLLGLPVSLDSVGVSFDGGKPALYIAPRISLGGGDEDFAATAGLKFIGALDVGDVERFHFETVLLEKVKLENVHVAGITLNGELDIKNTETQDEIEGHLDASFPMGIGGYVEATFGSMHNGIPQYSGDGQVIESAQHYSYWRVDGMVSFGAGIPLFSGFAMYGFGGGAYYHMSRDREPHVGPVIIVEQDKDAPAPAPIPASSGAHYTANYTVPLGFRVGLLLGTHPKPDALNMNVSVEAQFTDHGGLGRLEILGRLYGLSAIQDSAQAPVKGRVSIVYDNTGGEGVVDGNFDVFLKMTPISGSGPNDLLVHAGMHSGPDGWFFKMGEPKMDPNSSFDPRGGIELDLAIFKAGAHAYLMTGSMDVPLDLPPLPELITRILARAGGTTGEHGGVDGTATSASLQNRPRDGMEDLLAGAGFAFGAEIAADMDLDLVILYAHLAATIGFDINMTKQTMLCAGLNGGPNYEPGSNGWYAQGQFYAGLEGEVGIQLPLIFTTLRVPIVELGAAMVLQGNLPNPFGFRGEAGLYFSVLGYEGRARLRVEAGEKCVLVNNDPLAGMRFIQEVRPNGTTASIYDLPTATFSKSMDHVFEVPRSNDGEGNITLYTFRPYIKTFDVQESSGFMSFSSVPNCTRKFSDDTHAKAYLDRTAPLKPNRAHRTTVRVQVSEKVNGIWKDYTKNGVVWQEDTVVTFTTGPAPDVIPESNVDYTYPVARQRFFLPGESNRKGCVQVHQSVASAFPATLPNGNNTATCSYRARFVPVGGGSNSELPVVYSGGNTIPLDLPALLPEQVYTCQIIRRRELSGMEMIQGSGPISALNNTAANGVDAAAANVPLTTYLSTRDGSTMNVNSASARLQQATSMAANEHLLYQFTFRTSKFNTLQQKLSGLQLTGRLPSVACVLCGEAKGGVQEVFDEFDLNGVFKDGVRKLAPLLRTIDKPTVGSEGGYDGYYGFLDDALYSPAENSILQTSYTFTNGEHAQIAPAGTFYSWATWNSRYQPMFTYNGEVRPPLTSDEVLGTTPASASSGSTTTLATGWSGLNLPGITGGSALGNSAMTGNTIPGPQLTAPLTTSITFLYKAHFFAELDRALIGVRAATVLYTRTAPNNRTLETALLQFDQARRARLTALKNMAWGYLHPIADNQPAGSGEMVTNYDPTYHLKLGYGVPGVIPGAINTSVVLPFTFRNTDLPDGYSGSVLSGYTLY